MRFLADMGVHGEVAEWLRGQGHDVLHVRNAGMQRAQDREIFLKAVGEGRVVITFDLDFGEIVALSGDTTTSVLLFRMHDTHAPHLVTRLATVLRAAHSDLAAGAVVVIEEGRHRVRRLPIR